MRERGELRKRTEAPAIGAHADLADVTANQHQPQQHDHSLGVDGTPLAATAIPTISATKIGTGILAVARIPTISANKVGSDVFETGRIPTIAPAKAQAVSLSGSQNILGLKTFGTIPVLPATNPTNDNQAARKAYVDAQVGGVKEAFCPVVVAPSMTNIGNYPAGYVPTLQYAFMAWRVPTGFSSLEDAKIAWIPDADKTLENQYVTIQTHFAAAGEVYSAHSGSSGVGRSVVTQNLIYEDSFATALGGLTVGDLLGIEARSAMGMHILGAKISYT